MRRSHFHEFEAYEQAVRDANVHFTLPKLERPTWQLCDLDLTNLHIQVGLEGCGNLAEGACRDDGFVLFFQLSGSRGRANGQLLTQRRVLVMGPGAEFYIACQDAHDWATIFLPAHFLSRCPRFDVNRGRVWQVESPVVTRLTRALRKIMSAERNSLTTLESPAALAALDEDLLLHCAQLFPEEDSRTADRQGRPPRPRKEIIDHAVALMDDCENIPTLYQLTCAVKVSERTLRNVFLEFFGMSPHRYLELRRLHRARQLLKRSRGARVTIAQVAGAVGMWDFGRFASRYRRLFGELPSESLRQQEQLPERPRSVTPWRMGECKQLA